MVLHIVAQVEAALAAPHIVAQVEAALAAPHIAALVQVAALAAAVSVVLLIVAQVEGALAAPHIAALVAEGHADLLIAAQVEGANADLLIVALAHKVSNLNSPALLSDTVMVERDDKFLFLVPSKPDWIVTNANGAYLLSLCDGKRSVSDILEISEQRKLNRSESANFLDSLINGGFFVQRGDNPELQKTTKYLKSVHLNMHPSCNLACIYCYAEDRASCEGTLNLDEYYSLINRLSELNPSLNIEFTGGEPLLNKNTIEIAQYARTKGHTTRLITNGTAINDKNVLSIISAFHSIRISLDGPNANTNDFLRGEGTFNKITSAIKLLQKCGAAYTVAMTVTKKNIQSIGEMTELYGDRLTFQPIFESGLVTNSNELVISGNDYFNNLRSVPKVNPMAGIGQRLESIRNRGVTKCAIGDSEISISHDGEVYPCHMVHEVSFACGNIKNKDIATIYHESDVLKQMNKLTVWARPQCTSCPVRLLCGGACRARALYAKGDLNSCDDFCEYEQLAYIDGLFEYYG